MPEDMSLILLCGGAFLGSSATTNSSVNIVPERSIDISITLLPRKLVEFQTDTENKGMPVHNFVKQSVNCMN